MHRMRTWRLPLAVVTVAATILLAGGLAVGSNMGFKLNKPLEPNGPGPQGTNWTSIPYNNPYVNLRGLCQQTGLPNAAGITKLDGRPGGLGFVFQTCADAIAGTPEVLVPGEGIQIELPAGGPASIIIVGSHDPTRQITIPPTTGTPATVVGNVWFSVPYHTTAVNANDLCLQAGMTAGGLFTRVNAAPGGGFEAASCPSADAVNVNLVLGEAVQLRMPTSGRSFLPAHF